MRRLFTASADFFAVLVFAFIGRMNHAEGLSLHGLFSTTWPFALGAAIGWSLAYLYAHMRADHGFDYPFHPERVFPDGVLVWVGAVVIGMILRQQFHQGVALSFIIVATIVLGVFLLGWRAARMVLSRRRQTVTT
ncbi:DUF3054 domain-containing protein [Williamsia muralis]|jgi:hypothetical protein|uniref:DUF3054 domain-containing protein n=1 Tax=Williamsia marianensis TaxID=85044 RepID=UPI000DE61728|nr:DUF3054 domain-containing protein [Williamsia marianensis]PVY29440.1 hypothetical protein C7458_106186 [Williamsia marianensis]